MALAGSNHQREPAPASFDAWLAGWSRIRQSRVHSGRSPARGQHRVRANDRIIGLMLRFATVRDIETLVRHRRNMWVDMRRGFSDAELDAADVAYRRWIRPRLRSGSLVGWIVERRGRPVASGCVWIQPIQPRPRWPLGKQPYLLSMFTEPECRGRGYARQIVAAATRWAGKQGYPRFTLHASDAGKGVYESLGWQRTWEMKIEPKES